MKRYVYFLINRYSGAKIGGWSSYDSAMCERNMLDDWPDWEVVEETEMI